jgi:hypothetical protein
MSDRLYDIRAHIINFMYNIKYDIKDDIRYDIKHDGMVSIPTAENALHRAL